MSFAIKKGALTRSGYISDEILLPGAYTWKGHKCSIQLLLKQILLCTAHPRSSCHRTFTWVLRSYRLGQESSFYLCCYSNPTKHSLPPFTDMAAYSHLGKYTSTFCFFTELAHSLINEALTSGSNVTSGTSWLERTIIILISSPSYGISRTW